MFTTFFYMLRNRGLKVSLNEWLSLIEGLDKGLCGPSLIDFYQFCRAVIVKSEVDYDKFDLAFAECFQGIETPKDIPDKVWEWLDEVIESDKDIEQLKYEAQDKDQHSLDELKKMLEERLLEQDEVHNGGSYWIGTGGVSPMGHSGYNPAGIRIGGESRHRSAVQVAGDRKFRDFRQDETLEIRHFQMAFRKLRQYSGKLDGARTELDIDATINKTCDNAGRLKLVWDRPRENTVKLLVLMDSDGSMWRYTKLCNKLFKALEKANHFKELKTYYFHNCIYEHVYTDPSCMRGQWIDTEWLFKNLDSDYRVIIVGDAAMAPSELLSKGGNAFIGLYNQIPGATWLRRFKKKYPHTVWFNPIRKHNWDRIYGYATIQKIKDIFPMYELTLDGLEAGIKKLIVNR